MIHNGDEDSERVENDQRAFDQELADHHSHEKGRGHKRHHRRGPHIEDERTGHGQRDFWREWRDERHGHGPHIPLGQPLSPKEMEAWRDFFHKTFGTWPEEHWIFGGRRFSPWHQGIDSFNPFVASLLSKGGGLLPLYVLHRVAQQPRYGNEIMDLLAGRTNGQWVSNPGAIYPLLALLEREGFIKGEWEDPDKRTVRVYTITPGGQDEVTRIKTIVAPKVEETITILQELLTDLQGQASDQAPSTIIEGQDNTPMDKEVR